MSQILLLGPLADPELATRLGLSGEECWINGQLRGGRWAGIRKDGWPILDCDASGRVRGMLASRSAALVRYADVFGLLPVTVEGYPAFGITKPQSADESDELWPGAWQADLACAIAQHVVTRPDSVSNAAISDRLPMIGCWEASKLRGAAQDVGINPPADDGADITTALDVESVSQPYAGYFAVEEMRLRHRLHGGGWSPLLDRGVFVPGDAAVVLPWDPARDRVLLLDQFRIGPAARRDRHAWVLEPVAGRIDAGETPDQTVLREAREEAGVQISRLIAAPSAYMSPGAVAEYIYGFVGIADLPDGSAGIGGLDQEHEDIRGVLVPRSEMISMALDGRIQSGPLLILALWIDREATRLRDELGIGPGAVQT